MPTVSALYVYPIKSARGVRVAEAEVEGRGLEGDRRWMLVDANGRFLSQRTHPRLARVDVRLTPEGLEVEAPGQGRLSIATPRTSGRTVRVQIWEDALDVRAAAPEAHAWFSEWLGMGVRLVYQPPDVRRAVDARYGAAGDHVSLADGYPLLLTTEASLADLNARLAVPVPMDRFRPNVVVAGTDAFAEDGWQAVQIGPVRFRVAKPCKRCVVITVDQTTGARQSKEPLRTLAYYRQRDGGVYFGQNLIPDGRGELREGDGVFECGSMGSVGGMGSMGGRGGEG